MNASRITSRLVALLVLCFLVRGGVAQPVEIQMSVEGVGGDDGDVGAVATLLAYAHALTVPTDLQTGLPTGIRQHQPVSVIKWVNPGTPAFIQRLTTSQSVGTVRFDFYRIAPTGMTEVYYVVRLENARVVYSRIDKAWGGSVSNQVYALPVEYVQFLYERIRWTYVDGGIEYEDTWGGPPGKVDGARAPTGLANTIQDHSELEIVDRDGRPVDFALAREDEPAALARIFASLPAGEYAYRVTREGASEGGAVSIPVRRRATPK